MKLNKIKYSKLNSKQKENYNFHKISGVLADYGYNSMRLNDDWQGADFISVHTDGNNILKIQLKGRFTMDKKYLDKDIYVSFIEDNIVKIYKHDEAIPLLNDKILNSISWKKRGGYSWGKTPKVFAEIIHVLN